MIRKLIRSPEFRRNFKEGSWIASGQIVAFLGAVALVRVLTEYLEPSQYGELALGLTVAGFIHHVVMGGLASGISRFYSIAAEDNDLKGYFKDTRWLIALATVAVALIGLIIVVSLASLDYSQWIHLAVAAVLFSLLNGYNQTLSSVQNAARQRGIVAFHKGLDAWLKILLAVGMMLWLGVSSTVAILGYALSSLVVTVSQIVFLRRLISTNTEISQPSKDWSRQIWSNSWPYSTWGVFTWAQQSSDRWALARFTSADEVGIYVVLTQIGIMPILVAAGMLTTLIAPILFQRVGNATDHERVASGYAITLNVTIATMGIIAVITTMAFFLHETVFDYLVNERYHKHSYLMPWLIVAAGFQSCHHILGIRISAMLKVRSIVIPQILSAIMFVLLSVAGAFLGGVEGIVYAQVVASFIYFAWMLVLTEWQRISLINEKPATNGR